MWSAAGGGSTGTALWVRNTSTSNGIALWARANGTDTTLIASAGGSGPIFKGFGSDGGEHEFIYRLDWFVPLTGGGGGPASSANYAVNFTVGQSAIGTASSISYGGCLGYWCGAAGQSRVYLPLVLRNS